MTENRITRSYIFITMFAITVALTACSALIAGGAGNPPPTPIIGVTPDTGPGGNVRGLATVDKVEIHILESMPAQVNAIARGLLPDSCTTIDQVIHQREGNTFKIALTTLRLVDLVCTQVITPFEKVIPLDVLGLKAGIYLVEVNGVTASFEFRADNVPVIPTEESTEIPASPTPEPTLAVATPTQPPAPTATAHPCNWAQFVADVTVRDGAVYSPGATFTKTWRLKNIGSCTWTRDYSLVFDRGDTLGGPASVPLKSDVRPGESVDLSVELKAPSKPGSYRGDWKLRAPSGVLFGVGSNSNTSIWVSIKVSQPARVVYAMAEHYCAAIWRIGDEVLACPGSGNSEHGFVLRVNNPILENGATENEAAVLTYPYGEDVGGVFKGVINGRFPEINVQSGDQFRAVLSCQHESRDCDVTYLLRYRIGGGDVVTLGEWAKRFDGKPLSVSADLSSLAGKSVQFILTVRSNGSASGDFALWLNPRIMR